MSGFFCLLTPAGPADGARVADKLAGLMPVFAHQSMRRLEFVSGRLWLGSVASELDSGDLITRLAREGNLACAFDGHLVRAREQVGIDGDLARLDYTAAVMRAYRARGVDCFAALEGQFTVALADLASGRLLLACSRHAHAPLYVHTDDQTGTLLACSRLGPMGACGLFTPRIDEQAVGEFLAYGQFFADRCYFRDVRVLDSATVIESTLRTCSDRREWRYWDFDAIAPLPGTMPLKQHVREVCDVLEAAADRMLARPGRCIAGLSGGNDSRIVLGLAVRRSKDLQAWTFGTPEASDVVTAAAVCRHLGIPHLVYPLALEQVPARAAAFVEAVDGTMDASFAHWLTRAQDLGRRAEFVLNGYAGGFFLRGAMLDLKPTAWKKHVAHRLGLAPPAPHPRMERNRDPARIALYLDARYGHASALAPLLSQRPRSVASLVRDDLDRSDHVPWILQTIRWILENRCRRWVMMGIVMDRHFFGDGSLFYDYDLHDRCLAIPPTHQRGHALFIPVIKSLIPDLARIPCGNTGMPMTVTAKRLAAGKILRRLARGGQAPDVSIGVSDDIEARSALDAFFGELLADQRILARSFWDGGALRTRSEAHRLGKIDFSRELGLVATVELFLRKWVDQPAPS